MVSGLGWNELDALGSLLGGIFTAATFGTALAILVREIKTRRAEKEDRAQERHDEERRQARLVYASLDEVSGPPATSAYEAESAPTHSEVHVRVSNHSDAPIWDIKVLVPGRELPLLIETVAPHGSGTNGWLDAPADWDVMNLGAGCPGTPHWLSLDVIFVDNQGRRWRRSGRSEPVRLLDGEDLR